LKTGERESRGISFHTIAECVLQEKEGDHHQGTDGPDNGDKEEQEVELLRVQRIGGLIDP